MSRDDDIVRMADMLEHARTVLTFIEGVTETGFQNDRMRALACIRLLEVIGEAANRVSTDFRKSHPEIRWHAIIGLRNRLIHAYSEVDLGIVWNIISKDLPPLIADLENLTGGDGA